MILGPYGIDSAQWPLIIELESFSFLLDSFGCEERLDPLFLLLLDLRFRLYHSRLRSDRTTTSLLKVLGEVEIFVFLPRLREFVRITIVTGWLEATFRTGPAGAIGDGHDSIVVIVANIDDFYCTFNGRSRRIETNDHWRRSGRFASFC